MISTWRTTPSPYSSTNHDRYLSDAIYLKYERMRKKNAALCTRQFAIFHLADDTITRITNIKRTECLKKEQNPPSATRQRVDCT